MENWNQNQAFAALIWSHTARMSDFFVGQRVEYYSQTPRTFWELSFHGKHQNKNENGKGEGLKKKKQNKLLSSLSS